MIPLAFIGLAIIGIASSIFLKLHFSGPSLGWTKLLFCLAYNAFFGVCYLLIAKQDHFVYFGYRPDIIEDYQFIGWSAPLLFLFHGFSYPKKEKRR